jgi:hypothetical protein
MQVELSQEQLDLIWLWLMRGFGILFCLNCTLFFYLLHGQQKILNELKGRGTD